MTERTAKRFCGWTFACLFCGCLFVAAGGCKLWHSILSKLGLLLTLFVILGVVERAWGATWEFTIPATCIDDSYMNGATSYRNTNYEGLTGIQIGQSSGDVVGIIGLPTVSDSLLVYGGTLDSFKVVLTMGTKFGDFIDGDSISLFAHAIKRTPVITEVTDSSYSYGNHWQVHGGTGEDDQYATRETDGVHDDSVIVVYTTATGDSVTLWGDPDHVSSEWWAIRAHVIADDATARFYFRSTEYGTVALQPYAVFYGTVGAAAAVTYTAKKMVGVKK